MPDFNKIDFLPFADGIMNSSNISNDSILYKLVEIMLVQNYNRAKMLKSYQSETFLDDKNFPNNKWIQ